MIKYFDFETEIEKIDNLLAELQSENKDNSHKIKKLKEEKKIKFINIYEKLTPWQKVQVSRHSSRPHTLDYVNYIFRDLIYLHGDKKYADDSAIIGCLAKINEISIMLIGTEKGNSMNLL